MATIAKTVTDRIVSVDGAQANGKPVYIGGSNFLVQHDDPAATALGRIEVSNDKVNWLAEVTGMVDQVSLVTKRSLWARAAVASDAGAPQIFRFWFAISQENG